jgi:hypothetical protein
MDLDAKLSVLEAQIQEVIWGDGGVVEALEITAEQERRLGAMARELTNAMVHGPS